MTLTDPSSFEEVSNMSAAHPNDQPSPNEGHVIRRRTRIEEVEEFLEPASMPQAESEDEDHEEDEDEDA